MDFNDNETETDFDIFAEDTKPKIEQESRKPLHDETLVVEAVQIVRVVKKTVGKSREVLDTIKVTYPSMTYERALKIAKHKAKILGNCMVVEKIERIIGSY
jgi:hypothetical protein